MVSPFHALPTPADEDGRSTSASRQHFAVNDSRLILPQPAPPARVQPAVSPSIAREAAPTGPENGTWFAPGRLGKQEAQPGDHRLDQDPLPGGRTGPVGLHGGAALGEGRGPENGTW